MSFGFVALPLGNVKFIVMNIYIKQKVWICNSLLVKPKGNLETPNNQRKRTLNESKQRKKVNSKNKFP